MAEVARTSACLRFFADDLEPDVVTKLLGREPTYAVRKGDRHTYPRNGPPRNAKTGIWRLNEKTTGGGLDRQIAAILLSLSSDLSIWKDLSQRCEVGMFCGLWLNDYNQGVLINPATLGMLGDRHIPLELDIYFDGTESDGDFHRLWDDLQ